MCDQFIKDIRPVVTDMKYDSDQRSLFINIRPATLMSLVQTVVVFNLLFKQRWEAFLRDFNDSWITWR